MNQLPGKLSEVEVPASLPPVILFGYKRANMMLEVLKALKAQSIKPPLIIAYIDGAKTAKETEKVNTCLEILKNYSDIPVEIHAREKNYGCRYNIHDGISEVLAQYPTAVICEDDVVPSPFFYETMVRSLAAYRDQEKVFSIGAFGPYSRSKLITAIINKFKNKITTDMFFSNRFDCCGWATWQERWFKIDEIINREGDNPYGKLYRIPMMPITFDFARASYMQKRGKIDCWVTQLSLACIKYGYVHLISSANMVNNIGFTSEATHTKTDWYHVNARYNSGFQPETLPSTIELSKEITRKLSLAELLFIFVEIHLYKLASGIKARLIR